LPGDLRSPHARGNCAAQKTRFAGAGAQPGSRSPAVLGDATARIDVLIADARRLLRTRPAARSLFSHAEPDRSGRGAAFGCGALQGCGALLANRRHQDFPVVAGDGIAGGLNVTKPACRPRRSGWSRRPRRSGRPRLAFGTGRPRRARRARLPANALRARGTLLSGFALRAGGPRRPAGALAAGRPRQTRNALRTGRTCWTLRALETPGQQDRGG